MVVTGREVSWFLVLSCDRVGKAWVSAADS